MLNYPESFHFSEEGQAIRGIRGWPAFARPSAESAVGPEQHVRAFAFATVTEVGITIIPLSYKYKYREGILTPWHRIAFRKVACVYQADKTITHSSRMRIDSSQLLKTGTTFPTGINSSPPIKHKHIRSLSHHLRAQSIKFGIG